MDVGGLVAPCADHDPRFHYPRWNRAWSWGRAGWSWASLLPVTQSAEASVACTDSWKGPTTGTTSWDASMSYWSSVLSPGPGDGRHRHHPWRYVAHVSGGQFSYA